MNDILSMMVIALFIEAITQIFKPIWDKTAQPITVPEWISMLVGVLIAVLAKFSMLEGVIQVDNVVITYLFYIFTGIALGRGPSFVHDLWSRIKQQEAR